MYAAGSRSIETVRTLLDAGADSNLKDSMGDDALWYATYSGGSDDSHAIIDLLTCMKSRQSTDRPGDTATPGR
jgi:ankyrin repeat protein